MSEVVDSGLIQSYDNVHWFHPWEVLATPGQNNRTIVTGGTGIHITDETGQQLIDGPGGMWCVQIGYGSAEMATAIAEQAMRMPYMSPYSMTAEPSARLARKLAELAPGDLDHVFFTTGGSTAVETAVRFLHFRSNARGLPLKKIILAREDSYHGSTYLTASLSGKVGNKTIFDHETTLIDFVPSTNFYRFGKGRSREQFAADCIAGVAAKIAELGPENIAGFISEPVQASGGVILPPDGYLPAVYELCRQHDIATIADEVVTGFGRLGYWFASKEVFGVEPDIITTAKGLTSGYLPLGAAIISKRLMADVSGENAKGHAFSHGYTYSGHPVSAAAALKNIEIIERDGLLEHVRTIAPQFQARLEALRGLPIVGDVRGIGLVGCVDCIAGVDDTDPWQPTFDLGARIDRHCQQLGLLVRPILNMCVFSPPLVITAGEIDRMFNILEKSLRLTTDDLVREGVFRERRTG